MDAETRELLATSIRSLLNTRPGDLVTGLTELGWDDVVLEDEAEAVELLFTEQGRAGACSAALDGVMISAGGGDLQTEALTALVVVHPFGSAASSIVGDRLRVDGVVLGDPSGAGSYVVASDTDPWVFAVKMTDVAPATPLTGFDPASALRRVEFDVAIDDALERKGEWELATAVARRALACELIGNGRAMLDIAVEQVRQRKQFGRPIGANQTPRHRIADSYVQLEAAQELIRIAFNSDRPWDATVAKAYAGFAVETTSQICLQVCGAMGFTSEHPLGGYVKRSRTLDSLYGRWQPAMRAIGEQLLASRVIPRGVRV